MITADVPVFPNNVVDLVRKRLGLVDEDLAVFRRPLRDTDPVQSIGIFGMQWVPVEESYELLGAPQATQPTLQTYMLMIQAYVKDTDEERGLATHSVLTKTIRSILYGDEPLQVGLGSLVISMNNSLERSKRWGIRQSRYFSNELDGDWIYLSTTEFWLETETEKNG